MFMIAICEKLIYWAVSYTCTCMCYTYMYMYMYMLYIQYIYMYNMYIVKEVPIFGAESIDGIKP